MEWITHSFYTWRMAYSGKMMSRRFLSHLLTLLVTFLVILMVVILMVHSYNLYHGNYKIKLSHEPFSLIDWLTKMIIKILIFIGIDGTKGEVFSSSNLSFGQNVEESGFSNIG